MSNNIFPPHRTAYEITWKNMEKLDRPQMAKQYGAEKLRLAGMLLRKEYRHNI
jgi:hypothetical protein